MAADTLLSPLLGEAAMRRVETHQPYRPFSQAVRDGIARASICALFTLLAINVFAEYLRTGHVTGLLLLVGESLVVVLTIVRRPAIAVDRSAVAAMMTTVSLAGPALLRATDEQVPQALANWRPTVAFTGQTIDSPLEEAGFEPSVPRNRDKALRDCRFRFLGTFSTDPRSGLRLARCSEPRGGSASG